MPMLQFSNFRSADTKFGADIVQTLVLSIFGADTGAEGTFSGPLQPSRCRHVQILYVYPNGSADIRTPDRSIRTRVQTHGTGYPSDIG